MNLEGIETFLKVYETKSIVKASELLSISQSTCSLRIQNLEKEIGVSLLERHQGKKETILSPAGEKFLPIAFRWQRLYRETLEIKDESYRRMLKISSVDSLNSSLLFDFYPIFMKNHPSIFLNVKTYYSKQMIQLIANYETDVAICTENHSYINIDRTLLYEESFVILIRKDHPAFLSDFNLKDYPEVYVRHSVELEQWRNELGYSNNYRYIQVGNFSNQVNYIMLDPLRWGVVPISTALNFTKAHGEYCYIDLQKNSPKRKIFIISNRDVNEQTKELIKIFSKELQLYIKGITL